MTIYTCSRYTPHLFSSVNSQFLIHRRLKVVLHNATAVDDDHFCKSNTYIVTVMLTLQELHTAVMPADVGDGCLHARTCVCLELAQTSFSC